MAGARCAVRAARQLRVHERTRAAPLLFSLSSSGQTRTARICCQCMHHIYANTYTSHDTVDTAGPSSPTPPAKHTTRQTPQIPHAGVSMDPAARAVRSADCKRSEILAGGVRSKMVGCAVRAGGVRTRALSLGDAGRGLRSVLKRVVAPRQQKLHQQHSSVRALYAAMETACS